ncbi:PREDICTED: uncharacterized protein LOC104800356 [Tarenaya hassleriana]|uniref:uncharacterized protein LOC104800356 n=1 Tax=Tarenaya hassleriana TaxID=28532 RepID=UPI00053C48E4|nr:PREDICTED: uncharacterized protein LOC104800356 [Tarenaya hassleriana]
MENNRYFALPDGVEGNADSTFAQYNMPKHTELLAGIRLPAIDVSTFELNPSTIPMLGNNAFRGRPNEDPNAHLTRFKMMCRSIKRDNKVTENTLRLIAFPWTLLDAALEWCYDLTPDSIHTWEQLEVQFMSKIFPAHRTEAALSGIHSFKQDHGESLYKAWKRYKGYQKSCPHHGLDKNYLINTFFRGLRMDTKTLIRASCGGSIQNKSFTELEDHIEMMAQEEDAPSEYSSDPPRECNDQTIQMVLEQLAVLNAKLEDSNRPSRTKHLMPTQEELGMYALDERVEGVNYVANNAYSNTYNPGWKNHPNLSYKSNNVENPVPNNFRASDNSNQRIPPSFSFQSRVLIKHPTTELRGNSILIPHLQVDVEDRPMVERGKSSKTAVVDIPDDEPEPAYVRPPPRPPPVPFPSCLRKHNEDSQFAKFVEMLKKLEVTMPFTDAISQIPSYLKDILIKKRVVEKETVALTAECSALIQHELPLKRMNLQLADRSIKYPAGILEDVPLKVGNFYIPVDFVVLDMDEDSKVPIILGRPFVNTVDAIIHVRAGRLTMKIGDETVEFTLDKILKQP